MRLVKEVLKGLLVLGVVLLVGGAVGTYETHYDKQMFVWTREGDDIVLEDARGEQWVWEDSEHLFEEGDKVKVKMFTNYTDNNIYDDEIIKVKRLDK